MTTPALNKREERQRHLKEAAFRQMTVKADDGEEVVILMADVEAEVEADQERGIITAYANIKNVWDLYNDIGRDECYLDAIREGFTERLAADRPPSIKVLYQHRWSDPIGIPIHMEEDDHGLLTESRIVAPDEGLGKRVLTLAHEGVLDSMSIGFRLKRSDYRWLDVSEMSADDLAALPADPYWMPPREIFRYRIYEYSPVTFPGAPGSDILEVIKSIDRQVWGGWKPEERQTTEPVPPTAPPKSADGAVMPLSLDGLRALRDGVNAAIQTEEAKHQPTPAPPVNNHKLSALSLLAAGLKSLTKE